MDSFEEGNRSLGIFLDLSKAYHCLNHQKLLCKLEKYGIRGNALKWFTSYLSNIIQKTEIMKDNKCFTSDFLNISLGIPQGSVIGPILFIIYVNDLPNALKNSSHRIVSFADDTNLQLKSNNLCSMIEKANDLFNCVFTWFLNNKLILNEDKTNCIIFKTRQSNFLTPEFLTINNNVLNTSSNTRFLGLYLDENLDWCKNTEMLCNKLNRIHYLIRVLKRYVDQNTLKTVYYANFQSTLKFGIIFWGQCKDIQNIFVIQKNVIRTLFGMKYNESCRGIFRKHKILTVIGLYIYEILIFMFKNMSKFVNLKLQSQRTLDFKYPVHRLTIYEKGCYYSCVVLFNKLPKHIQSEIRLKMFYLSI